MVEGSRLAEESLNRAHAGADRVATEIAVESATIVEADAGRRSRFFGCEQR